MKAFLLNDGWTPAEGACSDRPCGGYCDCYYWVTSGFFFVACAVAGALQHMAERSDLYRDGYRQGFSQGYQEALRKQWEG